MNTRTRSPLPRMHIHFRGYNLWTFDSIATNYPTLFKLMFVPFTLQRVIVCFHLIAKPLLCVLITLFLTPALILFTLSLPVPWHICLHISDLIATFTLIVNYDMDFDMGGWICVF